MISGGAMRAILGFVAGVGLAFAQQGQDLILNQVFETDTAGWAAMGPTAALRVVPERVSPNRSGALSLAYEISPGKFAGAGLAVLGKLAGMQRLRLSVRADHDTAVGLLLSEKKPGGGDYAAWFWAPAGAWQDVELTPADFSLNTGPNDPADPDGKLDLDQVQGIGIFDLACLFSALPESPNFPIIVSRAAGSHTLLLGRFQVLGGSPAAIAGNPRLIDGFDRGFLEWITLGGMTLQLSAQGNPLGGPALQAAYEQSEGKYALLTRRLSHLDLSKTKRLAFDIASERDAVLVVSLELKQPGGSNGPRYNLTIFPPADRKPFRVNLHLSDFERDPNSPVPGPARVDASRLNSLAITDVTTAAGGESGPNTIWIGHLEALPD
jgi:hypothetical protein